MVETVQTHQGSARTPRARSHQHQLLSDLVPSGLPHVPGHQELAGGQRGHRDWARPTPHGCVTLGKLPPLSELYLLIYKSGQLGTCQAIGLSRELNAPSTQCRTDPGKCWLLAPAAPSAPPAGAMSGLSRSALNRQPGICAGLNAESPAGSGGSRGGRARVASLLHLQQNFRDGASCWDRVPGPHPCPSGPALGPCGWAGPHLPDSP